MESGSEITAKIRSAIKAKLVELGAYVDEELPDYIMVMIANKKTKEQMTNDLNLFLGKNSSIFTDWVHNILERLQAISQKASTTSVRSSSRENEKKGGKSNSPSKKKDLLDAELILNEERAKTSAKSHDNHAESEKSRKDTRKDRESSRRHRSSTEGAPSKKEEKRERKAIEYPADDQPEMRSGSNKDRAAEKERSKKYEKYKSHLGNTDEENRSPKLEGRPGQSRADFRKPPVGEQIRLDSTTGRQNTADRSNQKVGTVRPMKRKTPSPEKSSSPSRKRRSIVGQVLVRQVEEEELDYRLECTKRGHAVTSTVRVTERKITVPVAMQPKPGLFLKALNEANASVSKCRQRSGNKEDYAEPVQKQKTRRIIQEEINTDDGDDKVQFKGESGMDTSTSANDNVPHYVPTPVVKTQQQPDLCSRIKHTLLQEKDSRRVEFGENRIEARLGPVDKSEPCSSQNAVTEMIDALIIEGNDTPNSGDTRFFVTLEGVDTTFIKKIATIKSDDFGTDSDYENNELLIMSNIEQSTPSSSLKKSPNVITSNDRRSAEAGSGSASPYAEDNGQLPVDAADDFEDEIILDEVSSATLASPSEPVAKGGVVKVFANDEDERHDEENPHEPPAFSSNENVTGTSGIPLETTDKIMERCKFWPACKLADACPFHHPSVNCRAFPTCRFGNRCLNIHPKCRYDAFCTNVRCPFSHSSAGQSSFSKPDIVVPKSNFAIVKTMSSASTTMCKFGNRCANPNCMFRHPKPCTYGANCFRPDCVFSHPTGKKLPTAVVAAASSVRPTLSSMSATQKFKWVAPSVTPVTSAPLAQRVATTATSRKDSDTSRPELIETKS